MIYLTVAQAAERVQRSEDTIKRWVRAGMPTVREPITGYVFVEEGVLLDEERKRRRAARTRAQKNLASKLDNLTTMP